MAEESLSQRQQGVVAYSTYYEVLHEDEYLLQDQMSDPIAFLSSQSSDTMYFDQAMHQEDREHFIQAIIDEANAHIEAKHWELIPRSQVPVDTDILPAVWSMKRKRDIKTRKVYKCKARLNVHGGKQKFGVNYFETYAPVVTWTSIRIVLILSIINNWHFWLSDLS
ncbi:MAG: reverse transcriptase domain-containing protein [Planctomycetia bacterium]